MSFLSRIVADAAAPRADARLRVDDRRPELEGAAREEEIEVILDAPAPQALEPVRPAKRPAAADAEQWATDALPSASVTRDAVREVSAAAETVVASAPPDGATAQPPVHASAERTDAFLSEPARSARVEPERESRAQLRAASTTVEMTTARTPLAASTERSHATSDVAGEVASASSRSIAPPSRVQPDRAPDAPLDAAPEITPRAATSRAASVAPAVPSTRAEPPTHDAAAAPSPPVPAERTLHERPAPSTPRVHIGHLEVIVVAPEPAPRPAPARASDLSSRRYLRNL